MNEGIKEEMNVLQAILGEDKVTCIGSEEIRLAISLENEQELVIEEEMVIQIDANTYPNENGNGLTWCIKAAWFSIDEDPRIKFIHSEIAKEAQGEGYMFQLVQWAQENLARDERVLKFYQTHKTTPTDKKDDETDEKSNTKSEKKKKIHIEMKQTEPITDRKSKFVASGGIVHSVEEVFALKDQLLEAKSFANATHNILVYRLWNEEKNQWEEARDDDGEGGAGDKLLNLLQLMNIKNVVIIVTRWYGGTKLGPDRFKHINGIARKLIEENGWKE